LWPGARLLHLAHAFPMANTTPTRARLSADPGIAQTDISLGPLGQPASTSFNRNPAA
jgi:hypothetical protein